MTDRPFLLFFSRDDEGRHVLKVQGSGIPLTERRLTVADCLRHAKSFTQAALEIMDEERLEKEDARRSGGAS